MPSGTKLLHLFVWQGRNGRRPGRCTELSDEGLDHKGMRCAAPSRLPPLLLRRSRFQQRLMPGVRRKVLAP
jgi:hypothetical protein